MDKDIISAAKSVVLQVRQKEKTKREEEEILAKEKAQEEVISKLNGKIERVESKLDRILARLEG